MPAIRLMSEVPADVAADRAVDVARDPVPARLVLLGQGVAEARHEPRPFEQHEDGQEGDRHDADDEGDDTVGDGEARIRDAQNPAGSLLLDRLPHLVDDLVVVLQEAERASAGRQVLDEVRHGRDELLDLVDERRDQERPKPGEGGSASRKTSNDARLAPQPALLEELDRRVEREREEERDQDPRDDVPREEEESDDRRGARMIPSTTRIARGRK